MSSQSMHTTAFILSLIGGIIIVAGSALAAFLSAFDYLMELTMVWALE